MKGRREEASDTEHSIRSLAVLSGAPRRFRPARALLIRAREHAFVHPLKMSNGSILSTFLIPTQLVMAAITNTMTKPKAKLPSVMIAE